MHRVIPGCLLCFVIAFSTLGDGAAAQRSAPAVVTHDAADAGRDTLDLDLVRADLRNVLLLLAEVGGINLVFGEGVSGKVTLKLKRVHWEEAFEVILSAQGLEMERRGSIVWVARSEVFAARRAEALGKREQCLRSAPLRTRIMRVNYADARKLAELVKSTLSERGQVSVDARTNSLIVRDVDCD